MRRTRSSRNKPEGAEAEDTGTNTAWQWEGDDGQWEPYAPEVSAQLDAAVRAGRKTLKLGAGYVVDLVKMTQTNTATKYRRRIRRSGQGEEESSVKIKEEEAPEPKKRRGRGRETNAGDEGESKEIKQEVKKEEEEEEDTPITKKGRSQGKVKKSEPVENTEGKEVVKTLVMRGKAPVDSECKAKLGKAHVYSEGRDVYDVMLNQTNLQFNNNKYYLIQLLQDDHARSYSVWMRWGRVGKLGQSSLTPCGTDLAKAKDIFFKKFAEKTKNEWSGRASFQKVPGKYDMVLMDYSSNEKEEGVGSDPGPVETKASRLDVKLQALMELICDVRAMEECVLEMKFDTKKAPLGKLTAEQIRAGYASLKRIEDCLKRKGGNKELLEACNQFYTRIPHDFGLRTPPVIRTEEELKEKIALLEALSDIQIAVKMVQSSSAGDEHPVDKHYHALRCQLHLLEPSGHAFQVIEKYLQSTHATTHSDYSMKLLDVFCVEREGEETSFLSGLHNRMLLWHGSRLSNWVGILSRGLRVAPPEAPVTGYMFGKGVYFADMSSKSANYCFTSPKNNIGLLLLSEVALGECNELVDANYDADKLPPGKHSTKGLGQTTPQNSTTLDGVTVPLGPAVKTGQGRGGGYSLLYNEFVVYDPAQIRMRYLLKVQFNYAALW